MNLRLTSKAQKELDKIDSGTALRISQKIYQLKDNPFGLSSQKLAGEKGYRIRVGDYRVIYTINKDSQTITVVKIGHRKEVYR